ncbi:dynein axonemal intermediate chain 7-like [Anthonomus grandis grandis]|uniref:dynein axonemal intermediate chain 7-like n=1 Tax=Anthonomus grandis grandis TaxID=2921223 RepID=UPI002165DAE1|nr:dynein axonemal intermediate chain 7-like [Anthonomus grandis grandis]
MGKKGGKKGKVEKVVENAEPLPTIPEEGDVNLEQANPEGQATTEVHQIESRKSLRKSKSILKEPSTADAQERRSRSKSVVIENVPIAETADNIRSSADTDNINEPDKTTDEQPQITFEPEITQDVPTEDKGKKAKGKKGKKDKKEDSEADETTEEGEVDEEKPQKKGKKGKKGKTATFKEQPAEVMAAPEEGVEAPIEGKKSKKKGKKDKTEKAEAVDAATETDGEMPQEGKSKTKKSNESIEKIEAEEGEPKKGKKGKKGIKGDKSMSSDMLRRKLDKTDSKLVSDRTKSFSFTAKEKSMESVQKSTGSLLKSTKRDKDEDETFKGITQHRTSSLKESSGIDIYRKRSSRLSATYSEISTETAEIIVEKDEKEVGKKKKDKKKGKKKAEEEELTEEEKEQRKLEKKAEKKALKAEKKAAKKAARLEALARKKAEKSLALGEDLDLKKKLDELKKAARALGIDEQTLAKSAAETEDQGVKKKQSKKDKAKISAEMAEKAKAEQEAQAKRLEELIKKKKEEERLAAIEKDKREIYEQGLRVEQLNDTYLLIAEVINSNVEAIREEKEILEWQKYIACGKLPNPAMCDQMNTYLHLWGIDLDKTSIEDASSRTADAIKLLTDLDELIDTVSPEDSSKLENWKWVRQLFRDYQASSLDVATYRLLRNVEHNLNRLNIPTADFNFKDDIVTLCIWLRVMLPIPLPNPRRPPKPRIDVTFKLMDVSVLFPFTIDCENAALRAMYLKYDHLSDLNENFYMPPVPDDYHMDLFSITKKEWQYKLKYKYDNRDKETKRSTRDEKLEVQEEVQLGSEIAEDNKSTPETEPMIKDEKKISIKSVEGEIIAPDETEPEIPIVPFKQLNPTASEFAISLEDQLYDSTRDQLRIEVPENVINLRKFVILGGVYHLNLLAQPPQPQNFITMDMTITGLYLPKKLEVLPFKVVYTPYVPPPDPEPSESNTSVRKLPEELEEEQKKMEEELDKLILINIKWPQHVIFLELPIVCRWDDVEKRWSSEEIHDVKHNEDKCMLSFRTGVFGIYALAAYRYSNLPFQAYDIKPEVDESVTVQLTAAILMLEFNVKNGLIAITQLQNSPNMTLQDCVGKYMKLHKLKRMMKEAGIDIFPEFDAFCYVEGSCEKQWAMEQHLYYNMAQISNCFNFAWSRWNLQAGRRQIVLQMRQYLPDKGKQKNHQMLLVTPLKAAFVDCTEVSPAFSDKDVESLKFCADLYHLMKISNGIFVRNKVSKTNKQNVYTLAQFLISIRVLSFS